MSQPDRAGRVDDHTTYAPMEPYVPTPDPEEMAAAIASINEAFAELNRAFAQVGADLKAAIESVEAARLAEEAEATR